MGRIARKGFEYYRAETDRFRDIKIRKLKKEYSCAGYAIYQYVLNEIYRVEGCYIRFTEEELFDCGEYWNMKDEEVLRIINYCAETGLFNASVWKGHGILTSRSIQLRYASMCHVAKRKTIIPEDINLLSREEDCNSIPAPVPAIPTITENGSVLSTSIPSTAVTTEAAPPITDIAVALEAAKRFVPETILPEQSGVIPEESGNIPENTIINKSKANNISSSTPSTIVSELPAIEEEEVLLADLKYLNLNEDQIRWACILKNHYPEMQLEWAVSAVKDSILAGNYSYSVGNLVTPLIENYIKKYNAEYSRKKKEDGRGDELDRMGIPQKEKEIILKLAAATPLVYDAAMAEIKRSKGKIKSPVCFLKSRLMPAKTA